MKKEILRISNLDYCHKRTVKLENISLCVLEGECVGFFGLAYSGKNFLVSLLNGDIEEASGKFSFYIDGHKVDRNKPLKEKVYHMSAQNYLIDDWTVAEYISLVDSGWFHVLLHGKTMGKNVESCFTSLGLEFDVSRKIRDLTEPEKRIMDLVKALTKGAKLAIIEDEFEGMDIRDIQFFADTMKKLIAGRMAVIINSNSYKVMQILSDKYIFFSGRHIVKKCPKDYIRDHEHLERYLLGDAAISPKSELHRHDPENVARKAAIYQVKGVRLRDGQRKDFEFAKGEVTAFLILNGNEKEYIFMFLSGRQSEEDTEYLLDGSPLTSASAELFEQKKIVSVKAIGGSEELFPKMTVEENLILPSLSKISSWEYIAASGNLIKMAAKNSRAKTPEKNIPAGSLKINERIRLVLERWYFYNPKVLVLFEPFIMCDAYGVSIVKSYIQKFAKRGTAVIICQSREEYIEDLSDRIIHI